MGLRLAGKVHPARGQITAPSTITRTARIKIEYLGREARMGRSTAHSSSTSTQNWKIESTIISPTYNLKDLLGNCLVRTKNNMSPKKLHAR